jgi:hypothetical protein
MLFDQLFAMGETILSEYGNKFSTNNRKIIIDHKSDYESQKTFILSALQRFQSKRTLELAIR